MNRSIFHGMRTGRDWHELESRANWTDLIAVVIGLVLLVVGCGVVKGLGCTTIKLNAKSCSLSPALKY